MHEKRLGFEIPAFDTSLLCALGVGPVVGTTVAKEISSSSVATVSAVNGAGLILTAVVDLATVISQLVALCGVCCFTCTEILSNATGGITDVGVWSEPFS